MNAGLRQTLLLCGLGLGLAAASALLHPARERVADVLWSAPEIDTAELADGSGPRQWIDARSLEDFNAAHVPGAIHLSPENYDEGFGELLRAWRPGQRVVVYCHPGACDTAQAVARRLGRDLRSREIRVLQGGWAPAKEAGR
jgi:rhodanese-related sulfurtransferase